MTFGMARVGALASFRGQVSPARLHEGYIDLFRRQEGCYRIESTAIDMSAGEIMSTLSSFDCH